MNLFKKTKPACVQHVHDIAAIASYGVMSTPALVIDGKVVSEGRILSPDEIQTLLKKEKEENETGHGE